MFIHFELFPNRPLTAWAGAIDVHDTVADGESTRMVGLQAGGKLLALDARDAVTVVADLVTAGMVVSDALKDRRRKVEWVTNQQIRLNQQLQCRV